jgi:4-amino-4-deoxy-L-arabinose transferase-like glycosyltransferase
MESLAKAKSQRILLFFSILIIATFFRFYHLPSAPPGLHLDEPMDGNNAVEVAQTGHYQAFYTEDNGREGLYVNILAVLFQFFHPRHEPWVVRLPAAVVGVLTVIGVYLLAAELFGNGPGLLAAFLLATSFWHINFSRIAYRAILAPFFLTWSLYLLIKTFKAASSRRAAWYSVIAGIVYALGFYTYIPYRVTPLLFLLFIPFFKEYPGFWKRGLIFVIAAFIVAAPMGWYFVQHPADFFGRASQISIMTAASPIEVFIGNTAETIFMFNVHGDHNWRHNVSGAPELFFPVGILFLIGIIRGIYSLWKNWREKSAQLFAPLFIFLWFALAVLPAAASNEGIPHALRTILLLPPTMIFTALGGIWLYKLMKTHWGRNCAMAVALIFLISVAMFAYVDYFIIWAGNPNVPPVFDRDYVTIGYEINALPLNTPKYVVVDAGGTMIRGIPLRAEPTIFITDTFSPKQQQAKNVHYLLPDELNQIQPGAVVFYIRKIPD